MLIDVFRPKDASVKRHLLKTISWRIVGTVDTVIIGWMISGEPMIGIKVGGVEVVTKMILYFVHERVWYKINIGLPHRENINKKEQTDKK